jgi:hypothetical protein
MAYYAATGGGDAAGIPLMALGGSTLKAVATGAGNTIISAAAGRLCRISITTTGTAAASPGVPIYDNATTNSGTVIFVIPGNAAVGTSYDVSMPCLTGLVAANVLNGPAFTASYY